MKAENVINNGYKTEIGAQFTYDLYDVLIVDIASLDDDGWQIRECYLSIKGEDDYTQVTNGDGYNGWDIATECGYPTKKHTEEVTTHLGVTPERLEALMTEIDDQVHLNSRDWSILESLREEE